MRSHGGAPMPPGRHGASGSDGCNGKNEETPFHLPPVSNLPANTSVRSMNGRLCNGNNQQHNSFSSASWTQGSFDDIIAGGYNYFPQQGANYHGFAQQGNLFMEHGQEGVHHSAPQQAWSPQVQHSSNNSIYSCNAGTSMPPMARSPSIDRNSQLLPLPLQSPSNYPQGVHNTNPSQPQGSGSPSSSANINKNEEQKKLEIERERQRQEQLRRERELEEERKKEKERERQRQEQLRRERELEEERKKEKERERQRQEQLRRERELEEREKEKERERQRQEQLRRECELEERKKEKERERQRQEQLRRERELEEREKEKERERQRQEQLRRECEEKMTKEREAEENSKKDQDRKKDRNWAHLEKMTRLDENREQTVRQRERAPSRPPAPPPIVANKRAAEGKRIHTLVVVAPDPGSSSTRQVEVDGSVVKVGDSQFYVNEAKDDWDGLSLLDSSEILKMEEQFLDGNCTALLLAEGPGLLSSAVDLKSPSWCIVKKIVDEIFTAASIANTKPDVQVQFACAFTAVKDGQIADLLSVKSAFAPLSVRPSPLFGLRLAGVEYRNITNTDSFPRMVKSAAENSISKTLFSEDGFIVLSFMLNNRKMAREDYAGDIIAASLHIYMVGDDSGSLGRFIKDSQSKKFPSLFDEAIGGACHTLSIYVTYPSDKNANNAFTLQSKLMEVRQAEPRHGSVQKLLRNLDEAVEQAQSRLAGIKNPSERKSTEKFIENRLTLKESLKSLLDKVRPNS